jgi:hypothetical protein
MTDEGVVQLKTNPNIHPDKNKCKFGYSPTKQIITVQLLQAHNNQG